MSAALCSEAGKGATLSDEQWQQRVVENTMYEGQRQLVTGAVHAVLYNNELDALPMEKRLVEFYGVRKTVQKFLSLPKPDPVPQKKAAEARFAFFFIGNPSAEAEEPAEIEDELTIAQMAEKLDDKIAEFATIRLEQISQSGHSAVGQFITVALEAKNAELVVSKARLAALRAIVEEMSTPIFGHPAVLWDNLEFANVELEITPSQKRKRDKALMFFLVILNKAETNIFWLMVNHMKDEDEEKIDELMDAYESRKVITPESTLAEYHMRILFGCVPRLFEDLRLQGIRLNPGNAPVLKSMVGGLLDNGVKEEKLKERWPFVDGSWVK